ncbi:MAG: GAF domain-containing protein [Thermodesulfovibrionales bacterium]
MRNQLELAEKKLAIIQEITSAVATANSISTVANLMLDLAISYTDAEKGSLMLINDRDELYILAARGIDVHLMGSYRTRVGEGIVGTVALNRAPVLVEDIGKDPRFAKLRRDRYRTRSFISCPVMSKKKLLGVLNINDKNDGSPFSQDEFDLLRIIADQAAIALENASLMSQLKAKAAEMEEINRKLIESDVAKTETLTSLSHELRTPLNSIKGAVYHLASSEEAGRPRSREFYDIIQEETDKLIGLVENLLSFLRLEDEARSVRKGVLNLEELFGEMLASQTMKAILAGRNLTIAADIPKGLSDVVGDKVKVTQMFLNLASGLGGFLETGDSMLLSAHEDDYVTIDLRLPRRVPESTLLQAFHSIGLFREDQPEGSLRLYLAKKVAEVHRWAFSFGNEGEGFKVSVAIPKGAREKTEAVADAAMEMFNEFISDMMGLGTCSIMLRDELTDELTIRSARGLDEQVVKRTRIRPGDRISGWVALEGKPLLVEDIESDGRFGRKNIPYYNTKSFLSLPLKISGKVVGVVNLNNKVSGVPFTPGDLHVATAVADRISHFLGKLYSGEYTEKDYRHFMRSFHNLIDAEKKYSAERAERAELMLRTMERLGASEDEKRLAVYVSMIYDLGMALIDEDILGKKTLAPPEMRTVKVHPYTTLSLLNGVEFSEDVKKAILHHHERFDGTGYPEKLKGKDIPFVSRVLSVVDAYSAMTSDRPYRDKMSKEAAMAELRAQSDAAFDPQVVAAFEEVSRPF